MDRLARIWARLWLWHDDDFRGCGRRCIFLHNLRHDSALELKRGPRLTLSHLSYGRRGQEKNAARRPPLPPPHNNHMVRRKSALQKKRGSQPRGANANHYHLGSRYHSHLPPHIFANSLIFLAFFKSTRALRQSAKLK